MNRDIISATTPVAFLVSGVVMSFIGIFTEPRGRISNSVLWHFAQTPIYAGTVMGINIHADHRMKKNPPLTPTDLMSEEPIRSRLRRSTESSHPS